MVLLGLAYTIILYTLNIMYGVFQNKIKCKKISKNLFFYPLKVNPLQSTVWRVPNDLLTFYSAKLK